MSASSLRSFVAVILALWMAGLPAFASAYDALPSFEQVRAATRSSYAVLLDRHGHPLQDLRLDLRVRRLEWVSLRNYSPALQEALLAAEDKRFFQHSGVDWKAFASALWHNLWYDRKRGASTLSMQLAGLIDPKLHPGLADGRRSLGQKWDQTRAARALEEGWTKEQILEAYLNLAPFRGDLQGVHAAARALFGKHPSELDRPEALVLAVLLRGPNARSDMVAKRACLLAQRVGSPASCAPAQRLAMGLDRGHAALRWDLAPHVARRLLRQPGEVLASTLEVEMQRLARDLVRRSGAREAAMVVVDNGSGDVLAWVGGPDASRADEAAMARPVGSLLLPVLYGVAIERRALTAASLLQGQPSEHASAERQWMSVRTALAMTYPQPAQQVVRLVGDGFAERLRMMDIDPTPRAASMPGGAAELDLGAVAGAYRMLATGGQWQAPRLLMSAERQSARRVLRQDAAFIVSDIIGEREQAGEARQWTLRTVSREGGESEAVGFSERFTVAAWMAGGRAQDLVQEILQTLAHNQPAHAPHPPAGVVATQVAFEPAVEPQRREWFLHGTESTLVAAPVENPHIGYPANQSVVDAMALENDPGFRVVFQAPRAPADARWLLNGEFVGNGEQFAWTPRAGLFRLELVAPDGAVWDTVSFAVRAPLEQTHQEPGQRTDENCAGEGEAEGPAAHGDCKIPR